MTDDQLIDGEWIRTRLRSTGKTQRQLAAALGFDASGVSRLLDGRRKLRADELARIRAFFEPASAPLPAPPPAFRLAGSADAPRPRRPRPGPAPRNRLSSDIPVLGPPSGHGRPNFEFPVGPPVEYRPRPDQLLGVEDAYAIFAPGDALAPRYRAGEVLYVHPTRPPVTGCDTLVRLRSPERAVAVLRFLASNDDVVRFTSVNSPHSCAAVRPDEVLSLNQRDILQMGRILLVVAG